MDRFPTAQKANPEEEFAGQFVVSFGTAPPREDSERLKLRSLCVDVFPKLPVVRVLDRSGQLIGFLLGTPIDVDWKRLVQDDYVIDSDLSEGAEIDAVLEKEIYRLAGSFLFVIDLPTTRRLYLDAGGTKSVFYSVGERIAAATTLLLLPTRKDYYERLDLSFHAALRVDQDGWFPAGLTAHQGVQRLVCNHYLDFDSWTSVRHWPLQAVPREEDPLRAYATITNQIRSVIEALAKAGPTRVALTSGYDTRLLLACTESLAGDVEYVTIAIPRGALDLKRARELSERFGLRHRVLRYAEANAEQREAWQRKVSHCITGINFKMHPTMAPLEDCFFVSGVGGEFGRGYLWLDANDQTRIGANGLIERLKLPLEPRLCAAVEEWLRPLKHFDSLTILDLTSMELLVSSWAFVQAYALPNNVEINPLISRRIFEAVLSVPAELRRDSRMPVSVAATAWPDVLDLPINRYGNWRDTYEKARNAAADPARAFRKLRQVALAKVANLR